MLQQYERFRPRLGLQTYSLRLLIERQAYSALACSCSPSLGCRNIEISNNTVRNVAYQPECDGAGITVCVGGQPSQTGTGQPHQGVVIRNNAVYSSGGCGIAVTNAADVLIADNVITDTNVYGYDRGALYVNAVSEGTQMLPYCPRRRR